MAASSGGRDKKMFPCRPKRRRGPCKKAEKENNGVTKIAPNGIEVSSRALNFKSLECSDIELDPLCDDMFDEESTPMTVLKDIPFNDHLDSDDDLFSAEDDSSLESSGDILTVTFYLVRQTFI